MCRNLTDRLKAIESAKRETPHIIEVYDTYDDGTNLVGIVEILNETTARVMEVNRCGELEQFKRVPIYDEPDFYAVCRLCGMDPRFTRIVDNMA